MITRLSEKEMESYSCLPLSKLAEEFAHLTIKQDDLINKTKSFNKPSEYSVREKSLFLRSKENSEKIYLDDVHLLESIAEAHIRLDVIMPLILQIMKSSSIKAQIDLSFDSSINIKLIPEDMTIHVFNGKNRIHRH